MVVLKAASYYNIINNGIGGFGMRIIKCRTNHMVNPLGFAMEQAVVSWVADSNESKKQVRAQVKVARDREMKELLFVSDASENLESVAYELPIELKPRTAYYWTIEVWGDAGDSAISEVNYFETGKREEELEGDWLTTPWEDQSISPYIRKNLNFKKKVAKARLYMTGLGLYWLEVNGAKVGNDFLAPGCTGIDRLIQIYTYDLTEQLAEGDNVIGVMMGNGWTKGLFGTSSKFHLEPYLDNYLLKAELRVEFEDGTEEVIVTDATWKCTASPILSDSIYDGEVFDEQKAIKDWSSSTCCDCDWECMKIAEDIKVNVPEHPELGRLYDRLSLPIVIKETVKPIGFIHTPAGETVLDLGQNIAGWVKMRVHEPAGTVIKLSHGEILQNDCFYNENLRKAKAEYTYISDGTEQVVQPHFTFYGFRYVKIEGNTTELSLDDFEGCVVYSDLEESGWIETSDARINRLIANAKWSQKDNFLDVPTDCPQRNERMGWTGDAQMFCKTASYNMETYAFYTKYLRDLWVEQRDRDGMVGHLVPSFIKKEPTETSFYWGSCAWGDASVIIPWTMYTHYGDEYILKQQYPSMKAWVDWIVRNSLGETGLWEKGFNFGDWLALDGDENQEDDRYGGTDVTLVASAYLKYSSELVAKAANVLGESSDAEYYNQISERTCKAIRDRYYTLDGESIIQTQTAHILALAMDLVKDEHRETIAKGLLSLLEKSNMHLTTGFVGTPFLCKVLSSEGYSDAAYELLFQKDFPSWLYEVDMGATTIWERWNSVLPDGSISGTGMNSLNHYTYGSIVQWMYENMCGLNLQEKGFKRFTVKPEISERFEYVDMKYDSPKGMIRVKWEKKEDGTYGFCVKVPFDTEAIVKLPWHDTEVVLNAGEYVL